MRQPNSGPERLVQTFCAGYHFGVEQRGRVIQRRRANHHQQVAQKPYYDADQREFAPHRRFQRPELRNEVMKRGRKRHLHELLVLFPREKFCGQFENRETFCRDFDGNFMICCRTFLVSDSALSALL
jgi:hypothetical protein